MTKKELEQKLINIDGQLMVLGNLDTLLQQSRNLPSIISDAQTKKTNIETFLSDLPARSEELKNLTTEFKNLNEQLAGRNGEVSKLLEQTEGLQKKVTELVEETKVQLGVAANAKLASTFEQVKKDLIDEKKKMFNWLVWATSFLVVVTASIVGWQIKDAGTIYHLNFPVRVALLSPIVYFVVFINREYSRLRNLIEEYTFKAAIARSFEAYKEIVEGADLEDSIKTLDFVLTSIRDLYSSPMENIKNNIQKEKENTPDILSKIN